MNKMNKLVSTSKLSRALKTLWKKSKDLFATKTELAGKSDKSHNHDNIYAKIIGGSHEFGGNADKITTEQFIELLKIKGMFSHYNSYTRGTWHYANNQTISDTGCGDISLAGATIEVMRTDDERFTIRVHTATTADSSTAKISGDFIYVNNGKQYKPGWRRLFNTDVPPTWEELIHKPSTFPPTDHNHDTKYYRVDLPTITSGDFNNYYTDQGIHNVSSGATIANAPYTGGIYGLLTISERSGGDIRQTFIDCNHKEFTRTRNGNNGTWSAWIKVFSSAQKPTWNDIDGKPSSFPVAAHNHDSVYLRTQMGDVTDFNLCTSTGIYYARGGTLKNIPPGGGEYGILEVIVYNGNEVIQRYQDSVGRIFTRFRSYVDNGTWQPWVTDYTSANYGSIQAGVTITREGDRFYINY